MDWNYIQPVRIRFGNGMIRVLPEEIDALEGRNGMLITSPSFVKRGLAHKLCKASGGTLRHIYSDVSPNPDVISAMPVLGCFGKNPATLLWLSEAVA